MASKRRQRRNACEGKQQHATRQLADDHLWSLNRAGNAGKMSSYHCKFGDHWHVGHMDARNRQSASARARNRRRDA